MWVILRGMRIHLYIANGISYIASVLRKSLYLDRGTANQMQLDFTRICIEVNAQDELEERIRVDVGEGLIADIRVVYPWIPKQRRKYCVFLPRLL